MVPGSDLPITPFLVGGTTLCNVNDPLITKFQACVKARLRVKWLEELMDEEIPKQINQMRELPRPFTEEQHYTYKDLFDLMDNLDWEVDGLNNFYNSMMGILNVAA